MAYSFMTMQKIKSYGTLKSKFNHNCRKVEVSNVIPEFINDNDTLVSLGRENGHEIDYSQAVKNRIEGLDYYKEHKLRPDQVLAFEIVMTYSRDADIDVDEWERLSMEWVNKTFNVAPDNKNNIIHAICHKDEPGNYHIHAIVVPVDSSGKLNAKYFTNGSKQMSLLQSTYAESVSELGLERGIAGSSAKHKDIRKLYAQLNKAIEDTPKPLAGETADEYYRRNLELLETQRAAMVREANEKEQKLREKIDLQYKRADELLNNENKALLKAIDNNRNLLKEYTLQVENIEYKLDEYESEVEKYEDKLSSLKNSITLTKEMEQNANDMHLLKLGLEELKDSEPDKAEKIQGFINECMEIGRTIDYTIMDDEQTSEMD